MLRGRIIAINTIFWIVVLVFIYRLFDLQIIQGSYFKNISEKQNISQLKSNDDRYDVLFSATDGGEIAVATMQNTYDIVLNLGITKNPEDACNIISPILNLDENSFFEKIKNSNKDSLIIAKDVGSEIAEQIKVLELKNVSVKVNRKRYYPGLDLASRIIGFVGYNNNDIREGQYGLERYYNDVLTKEIGPVNNNLFVQIFTTFGEFWSKPEDTHGSIVSTISLEVQSRLEEELDSIQQKYSSEITGGIVMEPDTGKIAAMSVRPGFDLNNFGKVDNPSVYNNPLIENIFEMGSIIKPLTVAVGIDGGVITPDSTFEDKGFVELNGKKIFNHDKKVRGVVDMYTVIGQSLNTGVWHIVKLTGNQKFANYFKKLFGQKTNIDLPAEANSDIGNLDTDRDVEYATASFGQGIALSPIATIRALGSLANQGKMVRPHLIEKIKYGGGFIKQTEIEVSEPIFSEKAVYETTKILVKAVDEFLLDGAESLAQHTVAAKTGTAQIAKEGRIGYDEYRFLHSFFAYFPAYEPEYIILTFTVNPRGVDFASQTLTTPTMNLVKYLIDYYEIPPDRQNEKNI